MAYDLLVKNGRIIDGSGMPGFVGDVAVRNGKIVEMGKLSGSATRTIDATGQVTRLEETLNRNLATLAGSQNFEETVQSLAAVIHLLNSRLGQAPVASQLGRNQPRNVGQAA